MGTSRSILHTLFIGVPARITNLYQEILVSVTNFQTKITNSELSAHILEFLSAMARMPDLISNFTLEDFMRCMQWHFSILNIQL